ncbi:MAG: hypothetical protein A2014_08030 [Spirochaetes bacterium GWF1_49_6]|nr:MAG: hypothetical protein A2014_08030 [Spirochaetes bacterium GWF1_49_6]
MSLEPNYEFHEMSDSDKKVIDKMLTIGSKIASSHLENYTASDKKYKEIYNLIIETFKRFGWANLDFTHYDFITHFFFDDTFTGLIILLMDCIYSKKLELYYGITDYLIKSLDAARFEMRLRNIFSNLMLLKTLFRIKDFSFALHSCKIDELYSAILKNDVSIWEYMIQASGGKAYGVMQTVYKYLNKIPGFYKRLRTRSFLDEYKDYPDDSIYHEIYVLRNDAKSF